MELAGSEPSKPVSNVYMVDDHAYLCARETLIILDVSVPSIPVELGRIDIPGQGML